MLREAGFVGCDTDPISCRATFLADGTPKTVRADYDGGWRCELRLLKRGGYSLTQSISITIRSAKLA